jgi:hypothetical protein
MGTHYYNKSWNLCHWFPFFWLNHWILESQNYRKIEPSIRNRQLNQWLWIQNVKRISYLICMAFSFWLLMYRFRSFSFLLHRL